MWNSIFDYQDGALLVTVSKKVPGLLLFKLICYRHGQVDGYHSLHLCSHLPWFPLLSDRLSQAQLLLTTINCFDNFIYKTCDDTFSLDD